MRRNMRALCGRSQHAVGAVREAGERVQIVARRGVLQLVNIMVCTYNEPVETVKLCVEHLLAAEAPVYCKKVVYIGDDGAKKKFQCSEDKRVMCEEFHRRAPPLPCPCWHAVGPPRRQHACRRPPRHRCHPAGTVGRQQHAVRVLGACLRPCGSHCCLK